MTTLNAETFDFWRAVGMDYIIPGGSGIFPEGWDPRPFLVMLSADQDTVEFGCGFGRLSGLFDNEKYLGIDLNPEAIRIAKLHAPDHKFELLDYDKPLPDAPYYFAYTVFLHIDDETLPKVLAKIPASCKRFMISEIMGRAWRTDQKAPPVFGRDKEEYIQIMKNAGFDFTAHFAFPYMHYAKKMIENDVYGKINTNVDFLLFHRD